MRELVLFLFLSPLSLSRRSLSPLHNFPTPSLSHAKPYPYWPPSPPFAAACAAAAAATAAAPGSALSLASSCSHFSSSEDSACSWLLRTLTSFGSGAAEEEEGSAAAAAAAEEEEESARAEEVPHGRDARAPGSDGGGGVDVGNRAAQVVAGPRQRRGDGLRPLVQRVPLCRIAVAEARAASSRHHSRAQLVRVGRGGRGLHRPQRLVDLTLVRLEQAELALQGGLRAGRAGDARLLLEQRAAGREHGRVPGGEGVGGAREGARALLELGGPLGDDVVDVPAAHLRGRGRRRGGEGERRGELETEVRLELLLLRGEEQRSPEPGRGQRPRGQRREQQQQREPMLLQSS